MEENQENTEKNIKFIKEKDYFMIRNRTDKA